MRYRAEIERDASVSTGPGTFRLYLDNKLLREWQCITGGGVLDSREYGGLCPEIEWVMIHPIAQNKHPDGSLRVMSIIVPCDGGKTFFPKRTLYGEDGWPFMIHVRGSSTGCIAIYADQWDDFISCINSAFKAESFPILVCNM